MTSASPTHSTTSLVDSTGASLATPRGLGMVLIGGTMNLGELGIRIRTRRERRGLRQADLAAALRLSPQAVSKWERGENAPDISVLVALARLLDVTVQWLLGGAVAERDTFEAVVFVTGVQAFADRAAKVEPAGLAAWINGLHYTVTECVRHFDGVPIKYVGDGSLAFFSGPQMTTRAVQAALRCQELLPDSGLHLALHRGDIYLGTLGHPEYARPDILGATVNTAFMMLPQALSLCPSGIALSPTMADAPVDGVRWRSRGAVFEPEAFD